MSSKKIGKKFVKLKFFSAKLKFFSRFWHRQGVQITHAKFHHGGSSGFGEIGTGHTHTHRTDKRSLLLGYLLDLTENFTVLSFLTISKHVFWQTLFFIDNFPIFSRFFHNFLTIFFAIFFDIFSSRIFLPYKFHHT